MNMGEIPLGERPRERLLSQGGAALSDAELLATLLGSGTRGASALDVARLLIARFGDLASLARAEIVELAAQRGVGLAKACTLAAALEMGRRAQAPRRVRPSMRVSSDIFAYYAPRLSHLTREVFHVMCLDNRHRLLRDTRVVEGGLTSVSVLPREVFAPAIREAAPAVIFVHNHPSGDPQPSQDDYLLTTLLKKAGRILGIKALDHVIIGEGDYVSLVDEGQFEAL
jgi:DNA repair protein RadC